MCRRLDAANSGVEAGRLRFELDLIMIEVAQEEARLMSRLVDARREEVELSDYLGYLLRWKGKSPELPKTTKKLERLRIQMAEILALRMVADAARAVDSGFVRKEREASQQAREDRKKERAMLRAKAALDASSAKEARRKERALRFELASADRLNKLESSLAEVELQTSQPMLGLAQQMRLWKRRDKIKARIKAEQDRDTPDTNYGAAFYTRQRLAPLRAARAAARRRAARDQAEATIPGEIARLVARKWPEDMVLVRALRKELADARRACRPRKSS